MDGLNKAIGKLCSVEMDRLTAAEICMDECLTIMDRHGVPSDDPGYSLMREFTRRLHQMQTKAEGVIKRRQRLIRVRSALTEAFPMTDADLGIQ